MIFRRQTPIVQERTDSFLDVDGKAVTLKYSPAIFDIHTRYQLRRMHVAQFLSRVRNEVRLELGQTRLGYQIAYPYVSLAAQFKALPYTGNIISHVKGAYLICELNDTDGTVTVTQRSVPVNTEARYDAILVRADTNSSEIEGRRLFSAFIRAHIGDFAAEAVASFEKKVAYRDYLLRQAPFEKTAPTAEIIKAVKSIEEDVDKYLEEGLEYAIPGSSQPSQIAGLFYHLQSLYPNVKPSTRQAYSTLYIKGDKLRGTAHLGRIEHREETDPVDYDAWDADFSDPVNCEIDPDNNFAVTFDNVDSVADDDRPAYALGQCLFTEVPSTFTISPAAVGLISDLLQSVYPSIISMELDGETRSLLVATSTLSFSGVPLEIQKVSLQETENAEGSMYADNYEGQAVMITDSKIEPGVRI